MNRSANKEKNTLAVYIFLFVLLAAGIAIGGYLSYRNFEQQFRAQAEHQLSSIADLKVKGLINWRKERLDDAETLRQNSVFAGLVQAYFENPQDTSARRPSPPWLHSKSLEFCNRNR